MKTIRPLDPDEVRGVEIELARHIGPLARVLVSKAQPLAKTIGQLREALAPTIPDARTREAFIAGTSGIVEPGYSRPVRLQHVGSASLGRPVQPTARTMGSGRPSTGPGTASQPFSQPLGSSSARGGAPSRRLIDVTDKEMLVVEQTLSRFIGPMARMLVRKEASRCSGFKEFVAGVAATVDQPQQREAFLQALRRAMPGRSSF